MSRPRAAEKNGYEPRLKATYEKEIRARLKDELGLSSVMQVPRVQKITLNMGVGEAKTESKLLDSAIEELTTIAGQRAQIRMARKSIAQFKVRNYSRCNRCGRPRAVFKKFGLCRICLRELAHQGVIPGMTKSSW